MPNSSSNINRLIMSSFWAYFGIFIVLALSLVSTVILARLLDKENWGILSTVIAVVSFLSSISEVGLNYYIVYISSKYDKRIKTLKNKIGLPLKWKFGIILLTTLLIVFFANSLAQFFSIDNGARYFLAGALYFFLYNIFIVFVGILNGLKKFREDSIISSSNQILRLVFSSIFVLLGFGVDGALAGYILAISISVLVQTYILRSFISLRGRTKDSVREMFSFGFFYGITSIAATFTMWTDSVMLGFFVGTTSVGIYRIAVSLASATSSLLNGISKVSFPYFTSYETAGKDSLDNLNKVMKYILFIAVPAVFGLAMLSDAIVNVFFGQQYIEAAIPLTILSYFVLDGVVTGIINSYLGAKKLTKLIGISALAAAIINVVMNILLIPLFGMVGAAVASVVSRAFGLTLMVKKSEEILNIKFTFPIAIPFVASAIMALIIWTARFFIDPNSSILHLFLLIFLGIGCYVLVAYRLGFDVIGFANKIFKAVLPKKILDLNSVNKIQ
ncbi:MAG: flippase [Candidatus Micrarchaeota archaeon]|nr:flippase [Candidatus Micrarchaeota archaeon]